MRYQDVVHRVGEGLPRELADRAATMLEQTLAELLPLLPRHARSSLLAALPGAPAGLAGPPEGPERSADRCRERLEDRVANTASVRRARARAPVGARRTVCTAADAPRARARAHPRPPPFGRQTRGHAPAFGECARQRAPAVGSASARESARVRGERKSTRR